jgi:cytochrome c peroxidase
MMNGIDVETPNGPGSTGVNPGYGGATKSTTPHLLRPMVTAVTRLNPKGNIEQQEAGPNASTGTAPVKDALSLEPLTHLLAQASDINHHPTWSLALVTGMGSDNVLVLNTADSDPMTSPLGILEVGQGPKAVTFSDDGKIAYVLNAHSFTVSQVDLSPFFSMPDADGLPVGLGVKDAFQKPQKVYEKTDPIRLKHKTWARFGQDKLDDEMRLGRRLFTFVRNESISHGGRFTCNSCHYEGGEDHLVWFVPGGLRQTPQLAQRLAGTGPFNWAGTEGELQDNMSETIERMGGEGFSPKELEALEKYMLYGLVSPPNPYAGDETLADAQARGKAIFNDPIVACANCHLGEGFTDGKNHDVGTASEIELEFLEMAKMFGKEFNTELDLPEKITFNTPTLRDLHATAPYLHDGSAATLKDALIKTANSMGNTAHLSTGQMDDLVAYLLTL